MLCSMAVGLLYLLTLLHWVVASASPPIGVSAASAVCTRQERVLLDSALRSQCPPFVERSSPLEVSGEMLEKALAHIPKNTFFAVLFYASWCPFSRSSLSTFDALSTMFPQIRHFVMEESSALPSLFSRYGVHSFPSVLIVDGETRVRYHGLKDIKSLALFYGEITGLHPAVDFSLYEHVELANQGSVWLWDSTPKEIFAREPYLAFSFLFLCLRAFLYFSPKILSRLEVVWFSYVWHVNWHTFGEWSQLLERALHIVDVKRLCNKLRLSNKTNFRGGANNARVWASSLASVSLGESSPSSRSAQSDS